MENSAIDDSLLSRNQSVRFDQSEMLQLRDLPLSDYSHQAQIGQGNLEKKYQKKNQVQEVQLVDMDSKIGCSKNDIQNDDQLLSSQNKKKLEKYRLKSEGQKLKIYNEYLRKKEQMPDVQTKKKIEAILYFMMSMAQTFLFIFYILLKKKESLALSILFMVLGLLYTILLVYITCIKEYISIYRQFLAISFIYSWISFIVIGISFIVNLQVKIDWYIFVGISLISAISSCITREMLMISNPSINFHGTRSQAFCQSFLMCCSTSALACVVQLTILQKGQGPVSYISAGIFGTLFLVIILTFILRWCIKNFRADNPFSNYQLCSMLYYITTGLSYSFSSIWRDQRNLILFTIPVNFIFIIFTLYFLSKILKYYLQRKQLMKFKTPETVFLYQKQDILLSYNKNDIKQLSNSQNISKCIICNSEESSFFFEECSHVLYGYNCIIDRLKSENKECPHCHKKSDVLVEIQKVREGEFKILSKYGFPEKLV